MSAQKKTITGAYLGTFEPDYNKKNRQINCTCRTFTTSRKVKLGEIFELCEGEIQAQLEKKNEDGSLTYSFFLKVIFLSLSKNNLHYPHTLEKKDPKILLG